MKKLLAGVLNVALLATLLMTTAFANTDYEITEFDQFQCTYHFSDGLAAVQNNDKVGYMDEDGNLVIDYIFDYKVGYGTWCVGKFIDGKTIVFKKVTDISNYEVQYWDDFELYYIDKTGEIIGKVGDEDISDYLCFDFEYLYSDTDNPRTVVINNKTYENIRFDDGTAWVTDTDLCKTWLVKEKNTATAPTEEVNFEPSDWAKAEVEKAENYGIPSNLYIMGIETGNYFQDNITREEFATLIVGCIEQLQIGVFAPLDPDEKYIEISEDTPLKDIYGFEFTDTDNEDVYIAYEMGIVKGVGNDMFAPKQNITRQEIAVMMHRAIQYAEQETGLKYISDNAAIQGFSDLSSVADWAVASVGTLANNGIMKGTGETTLSPLDNTSREQAIILAGRIFELMK